VPTASRILLATGNAHKATEIRSIVAPLLPTGVEIVTLADMGIGEPPAEIESFKTFAANARAKATWCRDQSGLPCLADDSGLCVDALAGAPGVRSARWAGPTDADRNAALLAELERVGACEPERRTARFICSAAFAPVQGPVVVALGVANGRILTRQVGNQGFGYDPLFFSADLDATFAESGETAKNRVSHRARALRLLISQLGCFVS
jgi:XTP/dITP diphosphohydrolase